MFDQFNNPAYRQLQNLISEKMKLSDVKGKGIDDYFRNRNKEKTWADIEDANKERRDRELQDRKQREEWESANPYEAEVYKQKEEKQKLASEQRRSAWEAQQQSRETWYSNPENKRKAVEWDAANPMPESGYGRIQWARRRRDAGIEDRPEEKYYEFSINQRKPWQPKKPDLNPKYY